MYLSISDMGDWKSRDTNFDPRFQWQAKWGIWEFMILRHNNDNLTKPQIKEYLNPIILLNKKGIRFIRYKRS